MKKYIKYLLPVILVILVTSCTKRFDKINSNPGAITEAGKQELPFMFSAAESWACINRSYYQTVQNLYADFYAQYFAQSTNDFTTDRYVMHDGWLPRMGIITYVNVVPQLQAIFENTDSTSGQYALADIMWVYAFDHMTDYFGPIQYFDAGKAQSTIPYDAQDKIYADFFKRLDQAVANLQKLGSGANVFGSYDLIYGGSVSKWILFANTLRLRLAL
ncbi:MAG: SusD/RagB family nutrient-binding outer membrane lipoprotein, partial [Chitinophagaceae bacterium]